MCRVGAGIPDLGEQGVRTVEASTVPYRIVYVIHLNLQIYALFVGWDCNRGISECRVRARGVGGGSPWPSASSWVYTTATFRQADASATAQVTYVYGLNEDTVSATVADQVTVTTGALCVSGVGIDSTTASTGAQGRAGGVASGGTFDGATSAFYNGYPGVGLHVIAGLENGSTGVGATCTWAGGAGFGIVNVQLRM